ncbi:sialin-like isoform X1 [Tribolium castaneum]|uniref:sialin-like isoform X1 n=2 Tax=Tribolium castaneum TaxID=7070 RepID=UPI0030FEB8A6
MPPIREMLTCRRILTIMSVSGFIVNAVLKTVFNIAVVAMTKKTNQTAEIFAWDENQRQELIGIFFWGFALTKIPSGRLAEVIGSRKVTGYSMLLASILTILTPWISKSNYYIFLSSRVLMGFLVGASWPAVMPLAARWVPPHEQTIFISCIASTAVGAGIAFQVSGFLISALGWKSVFYVFGGVSTLWSLLWFGLIYDSPQQHPRISPEEKDLIESQIRDVKIRNVRLSEIPWISILTSGPVWAIAAGQIAVFFGYMTLSNEIPSYMDQVLHLEIKQIGIFAGFPYFGAYFLSLASSHFADYLRKSGKLSTTAVRKIFEAVGLLVPAFSMLLLVFWGYLTPVAVTLFTISITTCAISSAGHCTNMLDVSPNFAGTICGLVNTFSSFTAYISTEMVTALLRKDNTFKEWRFVFAIVFGVEVVATGVYLIFCSGEKQSWDSVKTNEGREEIRPLKRKNLNQNLE